VLSEDPGIVFRVRDRDNKFLGIHVIWLNDDLTGKRDAAPQRQCYGPIKGGYAAVLQITSLPCALVGCGENTGNMNVPDHAELIIAADNGAAGQKIATILAQRHAKPNCTIRIATPASPKGSKEGYDWNDALLGGVDPVQMRDAILKAPIFEQHDADDDAQYRAEKQVDVLISLASSADLFHDEDKVYADIRVDGHRETWPVNSKGFRSSLVHGFYKQEGTAPTSDALRRAIETIGARAQFDGPTRKAQFRVAGHAGKTYLDLCDQKWRAVEIGATDWRVITDPPVRFLRAPGMLPLPMPRKGGSVEDLRRYVNLDESSFVLLVAYIAATLRDKGPYPGLAIMGAEGTAKSTLMRVVGRLVDPHKVAERHSPRDARDLFIHASHARLLSFGNVSHISDWWSDALCSLATGGGFATRELYTDTDEILFDAMRPFVLNGIEFVTRPDLADRLIYLKLPPIRDQDRRTEDEFWAEFERQRPKILGALLDVVSHGLRAWPNTPANDSYPRMADFARFGTACEGALWAPGTFAEAYAANRNRANLDVIEGETIATAILRLMNQVGDDGWSGTARALLDRLELIVGEKEARRRHWPGSAPVFGARLRRIQERLRRVGIEVSYGRKGLAGTRIINIRSSRSAR
jgi:hypothetical protein